MGFFSTKETFVASTIYNLAGDPNDRPNYMKTVLTGSVVGHSNNSVSESFAQAYFKGPAIKLRRYFSWALNHYQEIGVPVGTLGGTITIDAAVVAGQIPAVAGKTVQVQHIDVGAYEYAYFAEQWMFENHPDLVETLWSSDIDEAGQITIVFENGTTASFTPAAATLSDYIYAIYSQVDDASGDWGYAKMFIYEVGSGNAILDALVNDSDIEGEYVPFIPLRLDNQFISETFHPSVYVLTKKAYKRILGGKLDDLVDTIKENEQLDEIDYAHVVFGVPLNVRDRSSREYLYRFFDRCRLSQTGTAGEYANQQEATAAYEASKVTWNQWTAAQADPMDPLYGTPEPVILPQPGGMTNQIRIKNSGPLNTNLDMLITWGIITETTGSGLGKVDAKKDDVWITGGANITGATSTVFSGGSVLGIGAGKQDPITIHWQIEDNSWKALTITDLVHDNTVYKNKSVIITAVEALEDTEESGFLVPLHMVTVRKMGLVAGTQMMTAAAYVVFNSYKVVKKKWYQTGLFKVVLFIVLVVISVIVLGPLAPGVWGPALAVGASLGLTGLAAVVAGTIINMLTAMIITKIIMAGATELLGAKWGALIGSIVSLVVLDISTALNNGATLSQIGGQLASASSIMQMTSAVGAGVQGFINGATMETLAKTEKLTEEAEQKAAAISDLYAATFGYDKAGFDPFAFTSFAQSSFIETEEDFLTRTLLTGSDIAEMSMDMVSNFTNYTLQLNLKP